MDCFQQVDSQRGQFGSRSVSAAFHIAVIEQALEFLSDRLSQENAAAHARCEPELLSVVNEASEALNDLKALFALPR